MSDAADAARGPDAVRDALVHSARHLMGMRSPRQISGRELAQHAGVNYGLIHHYFGTKDKVFAAAVADTVDTMARRWDEGELLPVDTTDDTGGFRTVAKLEVDEGDDPVRTLVGRMLRGRSASTGRPVDDPELHAEVAVAAALQFGWSTFECEILDALADFGVDNGRLRADVADRSRRLDDEGRSS